MNEKKNVGTRSRGARHVAKGDSIKIGYRPARTFVDRGERGRGEGRRKKKSFTGLKWKFDRVPVEILFVRGFYFERAVIFVWIEANLMVGELFSFFFFFLFPSPFFFSLPSREL